jgi:hypothetical protein
MDFGLTNQQKLATLTDIKNNLQVELYTLLIRLGIDPEGFTEEDSLPTEDSFIGEKTRIRTILAAVSMIDGKLAELS